MVLAMPERELTLDEAANLFGVPRRTLNYAASHGQIVGARRFGKQWAVRRHAVEAWLRAAVHRPGPTPGQGPKHKSRPAPEAPVTASEG